MSDDSAAVWAAFDEVVAQPLRSPWAPTADGRPEFEPDMGTLLKLLEVPLRVSSTVRSGWHAKAVDVWIAQELRRAGFTEDEVWPRRSRPRVVTREVGNLLAGVPKDLRTDLLRRLTSNKPPSGIVASEANVLGRAYLKQIDVLISHWSTGPELMVSTKRLGSSLSSNALNRVEESYGDAHNLRGRHPLAAIGYVLVLRRSAVQESPDSARRLLDLVEKMGREPGGYDATAVVIVDWVDSPSLGTDHRVRLYEEGVPRELTVAPFLERLIVAVLGRSPVELHNTARGLYSAARGQI